MLRKLYLVPVLAVLALPALASAQFEAGNWELTLAGSGANDNEWRTYNWAVQGSIGYFLTKELEVVLRETVGQTDGGSDWSANTYVAVDYHFDLDRWQPFVGWNIGKACGDSEAISDDFYSGPEAGVKYFVNATTFIGAMVQYEFNLEEGFDDGAFAYSLFLGFKW